MNDVSEALAKAAVWTVRRAVRAAAAVRVARVLPYAYANRECNLCSSIRRMNTC